MNLEKIFKQIILLDVFVMIFALAWGMMKEAYFPSSEDLVFSNAEIMMTLLFPISLITLYLLYKFKSIGRKIYLPLLVLSYGLIFGIPMENLQITNHFEYLLGTASPILSGVILTMIYLTDIREKFEN